MAPRPYWRGKPGWLPFGDTVTDCIGSLQIKYGTVKKSMRISADPHEISSCTARSCTIDGHGFDFAGTIAIRHLTGRAVQNNLR